MIRGLLIFNTLFQFAIGVVLFFAPEIYTNENIPELSRIAGGAAFSIGILSLMIINTDDPDVLHPALITLSLYHTIVTTIRVANTLLAWSFSFAFIPNLILAILFWIVVGINNRDRFHGMEL